MNREFKFRVWNKKTNKWVHGPGFEVNLFGEMILLGGFMMGISLEDLNHCILLQYVGLKDKNNKEIYEGDIVRTYEGHVSSIFKDYCQYTAGEVAWVREGFSVCQRDIGATPLCVYVTCDCCPCGLEVIGNIMEHPELINDEKNSSL